MKKFLMILAIVAVGFAFSGSKAEVESEGLNDQLYYARCHHCYRESICDFCNENCFYGGYVQCQYCGAYYTSNNIGHRACLL